MLASCGIFLDVVPAVSIVAALMCLDVRGLAVAMLPARVAAEAQGRQRDKKE